MFASYKSYKIIYRCNDIADLDYVRHTCFPWTFVHKLGEMHRYSAFPSYEIILTREETLISLLIMFKETLKSENIKLNLSQIIKHWIFTIVLLLTIYFYWTRRNYITFLRTMFWISCTFVIIISVIICIHFWKNLIYFLQYCFLSFFIKIY